MAKLTYEDKLKLVTDWAMIVDYHWHRLKGEMFNDTEFWADTLHAMTNDDWWAWVDIEPSIKIQYEQYYRRYPKLSEDTREIYKNLALGKSITRKNGKSRNIVAFRTLMALHDLINDIKGTPTKQYTDKDREPEPALTPFERMFDV